MNMQLTVDPVEQHLANGLKDLWFPVLPSDHLGDKPVSIRRLGYKIRIDALDADRYRSVVSQACERTGVPEEAAGVDYLIHTLHPRDGQPYYPCIPFDVISKIADHGRYLDQPARMTTERLEWAWNTYFGREERHDAAGIPPKNSGE